MSVTSKTGLLPILRRKNVRTEIQSTSTLELPKLSVPAPFTLRPFAGVYNPFPYACSILCNHPTDFETKSIVKRAKDAWTAETKFLVDLEELSGLRVQEKINQELQVSTPNEDKDGNIPEELFRKYTDTDSRPITPTPTLASTNTKNLKTRRCMTPDPTSFIPAKEKTFLVLDLRRSHSQETVYWQGNHTHNSTFDNELRGEAFSRAASPSSPNPTQAKKKKTQKKKSPRSATTSSFESKDSDSRGHTKNSSVSQNPSKGLVIEEQQGSSKNREVSPESSLDGLNVVKRRGKKTKKGKKGGKGGEKEFQGIPEPGETQVSALENDSRESSRQSLTEEEKLTENHSEGNYMTRETKVETEEIHTSFLNPDTLKRLQRQLDQEVIDSELNITKKIALEEALRHKKNPKHVQQGEEMKSLKKEFQLLIKDSEKWLSIPRVFTRRSARFELPMDSRILNNMTPLQYVEKYVFASSERLILYNHVFNLYKEEPEDDEERNRIILGKNVTEALGKIMGRAMTTKEENEFKSLLNWKDEAKLDFRIFTGITATCERIMSPQFCSKMSSQEEDPRHEIEKADFETLNEKLLRLNPDPNLVHILRSIRDV